MIGLFIINHFLILALLREVGIFRYKLRGKKHGENNSGYDSKSSKGWSKTKHMSDITTNNGPATGSQTPIYTLQDSLEIK